MKPLLIALSLLTLTGCASVIASHVGPWWVAHKVAVVEIGIAAGAASQVEGLLLNTNAVVTTIKKDVK